MAERTRVNLTVHPDTKDEWQNAVEETNEYSSLSDLIRISVARELSDSAAPATEGRERGHTEAQTEALEQVTDTLARMETSLSELEVRLTNVEQEVTATGRTGIKNRVFDALPTSEEEATGKSAQEVADELGGDEEQIREILGRLEKNTGTVQVAGKFDGQTFYTREGL